MKIHHIGYLVKRLDKALKAFLDLGYAVVQGKVFDSNRGIDIVFLAKDGCLLELVSPVTTESVVAELIKRLGNSAYHICYETPDIESEVERLRNECYVVCSEPKAAPACDGRRVCFLVHPFMGMVELLEVR